MQSLETKSSRPRPKSFETETRPETFETETWRNGSQDTTRDQDQVSRLHHWQQHPQSFELVKIRAKSPKIRAKCEDIRAKYVQTIAKSLYVPLFCKNGTQKESELRSCFNLVVFRKVRINLGRLGCNLGMVLELPCAQWNAVVSGLFYLWIFFEQVCWYLGKNSSHAQKFACSYIYGLIACFSFEPHLQNVDIFHLSFHWLLLFKVCIFLESHHNILDQGSTTYGSRAECGPPSKIIRPVSPLQIVVTVWPT